MIRATVKGLLGRKLRTALTAFAIVLGVAMVTGAYVVTDTMLGAAKKLENASYSGSDAVVSAKRAFRSDTNNGGPETRPIPSSLVDTVRKVPEVAIAQGMRRLRDDGLQKVRDGLTSVAEVERMTSSLL